MHHAVGAQALLTTTRRRICTPRAWAALCLPTEARAAKRPFRSSTPVQSQPSDIDGSAKDEGAASGLPARGGGDKESTSDKGRGPIKADDLEKPRPEPLRSAATASSGRARNPGARSAEGVPPISLPAWFLEEDVHLYDPKHAAKERIRRRELMRHRDNVRLLPQKPNASERAGKTDAPSSGGREMLQHAFEEMLQEAAWDEHILRDTVRALKSGDAHSAEIRAEFFNLFASLYIASFSQGAAVPEKLRALIPATPEEAAAIHREFQGTAEGRDDLVSDFRERFRSLMSGHSILERHAEERAPYQELLAAVRGELGVKAPSSKVTKDARRPVSVLSVLNARGPSIAKTVVAGLAEDMEVDVVHLDASAVAQIVGRYIGQTPYYARGGISMLGYSAAEMNGRLAPKSRSTDPDEPGTQTISAARLYSALVDDRWEDVKVNRILEEITRAADAKRAAAGGASPAESRGLIIHLHDYVELVASQEGAAIVNKLRAIVDRLWARGRKIVLVGSTSSQVTDTPQKWREQLSEITREDCYLIPFRTASHEGDSGGEGVLPWEKDDNVRENLRNVHSMLEAMAGRPSRIALGLDETAGGAQLRAHLEKGVYDIHWVYRFAARILALQQGVQGGSVDGAVASQALRQVSQADGLWDKLYASLEDPRPQSPFLFTGLFDSGDGAETEAAKGPKSASGDYTEHEKKLLSGLVNADEIKTTFDDVVAPPEIRESLLALTSLSLHRPEAFSYGVLARERIHGCLLYGPPGTGKTLMAKALAKESGANMLEVSAASINDMWVGNAEKNVRALFSLARKMSPMVIFLDEAESLLGSRSKRSLRGGYLETINQFLREWDGLTNSLNDAKTFVMVATNRPYDLDEAVLRRLPRRILVDLPLRDARLAILQTLLRDEVLDPAVSLGKLASDTELYSGSDLKNLCVAAAMEAVKEELRAKKDFAGPADEFRFAERRVLTLAHFQKALRDISSSISEDMESLKAIRKFDERYGDARRKKKQGSMGFEVVVKLPSSQDARIRQA